MGTLEESKGCGIKDTHYYEEFKEDFIDTLTKSSTAKEINEFLL